MFFLSVGHQQAVCQKVERYNCTAAVNSQSRLSNSTEAVKFCLSTNLVGFIVFTFVTQWDESPEHSSHVSGMNHLNILPMSLG
jgi:hypothetical protein